VACWRGAVIMSWEGERGLGWPAGGIGSHYDLRGGEGAGGVACWRRGWQSL
jgi:hypothetical protein